MSTQPAAIGPFANMKGNDASQIKQHEWLKIAILGKPKAGKSTLMSTAPKPIRVYDFDDRSESLAGREGLFILSRPTMLDVEQDLSIMKANKLKNLPL